MKLSSGIIALIIASITSLVNVLVLLMMSSTLDKILISSILVFVTSIALVYIFLEALIFKEVKQIQKSLNKIRKKDFKLTKTDLSTISNPLRNLSKDIFRYAKRKQAEIDQLVRLEEFRREFLADVSHELKTPIFAAQGFIHTLIDGAIDDKAVRDKFLRRAAKSLDGLDELVQDLLTLSKMEIGEIKMKMSSVNIIEIAEEVVVQLERKAKKKNIQMKIFSSTSNCWVHADRLRIKQALSNLIENAIKYGKEKGRVLVQIEDLDYHYVNIVVKDDGLGIPKKHLKRIFERFYRVEKSRSKEGGGSGLGLSIVKHIVHAHESYVFVESEVNIGTEFKFKLKKSNPPQLEPSEN